MGAGPKLWKGQGREETGGLLLCLRCWAGGKGREKEKSHFCERLALGLFQVDFKTRVKTVSSTCHEVMVEV